MSDILMSGVTGFVGRQVVKEFVNLDRVDKVYALVRDPTKAGEHLSRATSTKKNKVRFLKGDIASVNLRLGTSAIHDLKDVEEVYHLAASVSLSNSAEARSMIEKVNIDGTKNMIERSRKLPCLKRFVFVSTAYACGEYHSEVPESWLLRPERFRNYYEESKWESEMLIKKHAEEWGLPFTIVRPSIVLGNKSVEAESTRKHSIYLFADILHKVIPKKDKNTIRIRGDPNARLNFVRVQDLVKIILAIRRYDATGRIFNVVNKNDVSINEIMWSIKEGFNIKTDVVLDSTLNESSLSNTESELMKHLISFSPYMQCKKILWETTNISEIKVQNKMRDISKSEVCKHVELYCRKLVEDE